MLQNHLIFIHQGVVFLWQSSIINIIIIIIIVIINITIIIDIHITYSTITILLIVDSGTFVSGQERLSRCLNHFKQTEDMGSTQAGPTQTPATQAGFTRTRATQVRSIIALLVFCLPAVAPGQDAMFPTCNLTAFKPYKDHSLLMCALSSQFPNRKQNVSFYNSFF